MGNLITLAALFVAKVTDNALHNKNNIGTEKSVDTCRDCGYHIRLYLFLDHKTGGICGQ